MVYDETSHSYLRVIPKDSTYYSKDAAAADYSFYAKHNALQVFDRNLGWVTKKAVGPEHSQVNAMGIYYHNKHGSHSSSRSSLYTSSTPNTNMTCTCDSCDHYLTSSASDYEATLMTGSEEATKLSKVPSLHKKCFEHWENEVMQQVLAPSGHTYVLFADRLVVLDRRCDVIRSINSFDCDVIEPFTNARGLVVDECKGVVMVVTDNLFAFIYRIDNFERLDCSFIFGEPVTSTFRLWNSAMDWTDLECSFRFTFRLWVAAPGPNHGLWYWSYEFDCDCNKLLNKVSRHESLPEAAKAAVSECAPGEVIPAVINDYQRKTDIMVTRMPFNDHMLHFYTTRFVGPYEDQLERTCFDMVIPECIEGEISASAVAKEGKHDAFVITFTPSLDMLKIHYCVHDNVVAPDY